MNLYIYIYIYISKSQIPNPNIESFNIAYIWKHLYIDIDIDVTYCLDGKDDIGGDFHSISASTMQAPRGQVLFYFLITEMSPPLEHYIVHNEYAMNIYWIN